MKQLKLHKLREYENVMVISPNIGVGFYLFVTFWAKRQFSRP